LSSGAGAESNSGTTAVREGYHFDEAALAGWMRAHLAGFQGPLAVEQFRGGQSNPTYKLVTPGHSYVLRRKPPGQLLKGAHAVDREARVLQALGGAGYPVAHMFGLCTDDAVIAQLHSLDYAAIGLGDYGRPGNYFERQIARWSKQYLDDDLAGRDANMDRVLEWLPANIPLGDETAVIHGDFRIDNMIFHPTEPRILAVLDWELSTLGHAVSDFAYHAIMYRMPPDIVAGLGGADLAALNIPSEADYIAAYCRRTGRAAIPQYGFYMAFNFFRLAAIFHGIKGRVIRGTAANASAKERAGNFSRLAELAWRQTQA
jgi:aminoglycoside phosphotransferase (APT) family kinase protein